MPGLGARRHTIEIQRQVAGDPDKLGAPTFAWETVATRRAEYVPRGKRITGGEEFLAAEVYATAIGTFTCYVWVDEDGQLLSPKQRIRWAVGGVTRIFGIVAVSNPEQLRQTTEMLIYVTEEV